MAKAEAAKAAKETPPAPAPRPRSRTPATPPSLTPDVQQKSLMTIRGGGGVRPCRSCRLRRLPCPCPPAANLPLRLLLEGDVAVLLDAELVARVERVAVAQPLLLQGHVLLQRLVAQDLDLILQDLDSLLHFGEVLRRILNLADVLIPIILHILIKCQEGIEFELDLLLLFGQIQNE